MKNRAKCAALSVTPAPVLPGRFEYISQRSSLLCKCKLIPALLNQVQPITTLHKSPWTALYKTAPGKYKKYRAIITFPKVCTEKKVKT